ncbi:MAG: exodeoxyribonuclease VII large subunit [Zetaproteobacteria bacterium]|nr:MAG: exodeoxyribonuclease VII large subunit [Zetaproteobacteria bacterium]
MTVTELTARIKTLLERTFSHVRVSGEVSRLTRHRSGHVYFTIKDEHAAISAVIWRSTALRLHQLPRDGECFIFTGDINVYEPRGSYQLIVRDIEPLGAGRLAAEFERRKREFAARGWFDATRKQTIPTLPTHIGIVTSPSAAALEDVKKVLATRPGWLRLTLAPAIVQGDAAPESVEHALKRLIKVRPDVILLVRGGGSLEDLWCFNDERIVKAIVDCPIPIITGIGHEIDLTLADLAADARAATPSNAAELACPAKDTLRRQLPPPERLAHALQRQLRHDRLKLTRHAQALEQWFVRLMDRRRMALADMAQSLHRLQAKRLREKRRTLISLERHLQRLEPARRLQHRHHRLMQAVFTLHDAMEASIQHRRRQLLTGNERLQLAARQILSRKAQLLRRPSQQLLRHTQPCIRSVRQWQIANQALRSLGSAIVDVRRQSLTTLREQLYALGPMQVLARGYALCMDEQGAIIRSVSQLERGQLMRTRFHDGHAESRIESLEQNG